MPRIPDLESPPALALAQSLQKAIEGYPSTDEDRVAAIVLLMSRLIAEWPPVERPAVMSSIMMMVAQCLLRTP